MSNRDCVTFWAKNPETRKWTSVELWDGCSVTLGGSYRETFEGWRTHSSRYTLKGDTVYLETIDDVLDCDGRVLRKWFGIWDVGSPMERSRDGYMVPTFVELEASQRDYRAEKAGY